jgi:hypothetical protein
VVKKLEIWCEYQDYIDHPPVAPQGLYQQACSNDKVTIDSWRGTWVRQYKENHELFGPFKARSIGQLFQKHLHQPAVLVGSGPSLKENAHFLKDNPGLVVISCLHNFHFLEDLGVKVDYYVTLDAGPITIEEVSEGGKEDIDYWAKTEGKTLLAYAATHPDLLKKWRGEIYFYNAPIPDPALTDELEQVEKFNVHVSNGGNVLGACLYIAKGYLGCSTTIFVGANFAFSYNEKFHGWDSKYDDKLGHYIRLTDVYGNKVKSWASYRNFKSFFEYVAMSVPGEYINCTEGGTFGSYPDGNLRAVKQMDLKDCLDRFRISEHLRVQAEDPETSEVKILY